jgi:pilus assembly protein CpaB
VLNTLRPPLPAGENVWTAARDLPSGTVLDRADLVAMKFAVGTAPRAAHQLGALLGRTLGTPLGAGEAATVRQMVGTDQLAGYPGRSAIGVRIPDAEAVGLLRAGDRVDLVASDPQHHRPGYPLVQDAIVLAVPTSAPNRSGPELTGRLVVFAVPADQATAIATAATSLFLTVIWNR